MNKLFNLSVIKTLRYFGSDIVQEDGSSKIMHKPHKTRWKAYITHDESKEKKQSEEKGVHLQ